MNINPNKFLKSIKDLENKDYILEYILKICVNMEYARKVDNMFF